MDMGKEIWRDKVGLMKNPSPTQRMLLIRLLGLPGGFELMPAGYRGAGPDASRWWRTARIMIERGLVVRIGDGVRITEKGKKWALAWQLDKAQADS